jgi:signal recognition particle subunit SRP54
VKPGAPSGGGSGFGLGGAGSTQQAPSEEELAALQKLLGRR